MGVGPRAFNAKVFPISSGWARVNVGQTAVDRWRALEAGRTNAPGESWQAAWHPIREVGSTALAAGKGSEPFQGVSRGKGY